MKRALCLGGAAGVQDDWQSALNLFTPDYVIACNDAGAIWPGPLDAWVTLHPEKMSGWRDKRVAMGFEPAQEYLVHGDQVPAWCDLIEFRFLGQRDSGSSGLMTAKVALCDFGADLAVLCGVPLDSGPHFFDTAAWDAAQGYRGVLAALPDRYKMRIRSMGGWTADYLGRPDAEWLNGTCDDARRG